MSKKVLVITLIQTLPSSPSPPKLSDTSFTLAESGFSFPWQESITVLSGRTNEDHGDEDEIRISFHNSNLDF